jgi:hypothetical protein
MEAGREGEEEGRVREGRVGREKEEKKVRLRRKKPGLAWYKFCQDLSHTYSLPSNYPSHSSTHPTTHTPSDTQKSVLPKTYTEAQLREEAAKAFELGRQAGKKSATEEAEKEAQKATEKHQQEKEQAIATATAAAAATATATALATATTAAAAANAAIVTTGATSPPSEPCPSYHVTPPQPPHQGRRKPGECVGPRGNVWPERGFNYYVFRDMFFPYERNQSEFKSLVMFTAGRSAMANIDGLVRLWGLENFDYVLMHFDDSATEWNR